MNPTDQNRFYDITPPGQTIPPTSGRPIIVSNRPEQTDQMLQYPAAQPQYQAATQPQYPVAPNPTPVAPGGIYAQPYEQPVPELPAAAQPYANYEPTPTATGIYAPPQAAIQPNYAAPTVDYSQPQTPVVPPTAQVNPANPAISITTGDQAYVYRNRSLIKSILWLALLVFAILLFIDIVSDWSSLKFLPHTHLTHL